MRDQSSVSLAVSLLGSNQSIQTPAVKNAGANVNAARSLQLLIMAGPVFAA
jgi:hypothetical protein